MSSAYGLGQDLDALTWTKPGEIAKTNLMIKTAPVLIKTKQE